MKRTLSVILATATAGASALVLVAPSATAELPAAPVATTAAPAAAAVVAEEQVLVNPSFEEPGQNNAVPTGWVPALLDNEAAPFRLVVAAFDAAGQFPPPAPIPDGDFGLEMFWQVGSNLGVMGVAAEQTADTFGAVDQDNAGTFSYSAVQTFFANSAVVNWAGGLAEVEFSSGGEDYTLRYFHSNSGTYRGAPVDAGNVRYVIGDAFPGNGSWITASHDLAADIEAEFGVDEFVVESVRVGNLQDRTGTNPFSNMTTYWDNVGLTAVEDTAPVQGLTNPSFEEPGQNNVVPTGWAPVLLDNEAAPFRLVAATFDAAGQFPPPAPIPDGAFGLEMFWQVGSNLGVMGVAVEQTADTFGSITQDNAGTFGYSAVQTFFANSAVVNWAGGLAEVEFTSAGQTHKLRYFHSNSGTYRGAPADAGNVRYVIGDAFPGNGSWITASHDLAADIEAKFGLTEFAVQAIRVGNLQDRTGTNPFSNMTTYWDALDLQVAGGGGSDTTPPSAVTLRPASGATGVSPAAPVSVTFDESVRAGAAIGDVTITAGGTAVAGVTATASGSALTIAHPLLNTHTPYTVTVPAGAVEDRSGNPSAAASTWSFTTGDPAPDYTLINAVQGAGASTPLSGRTVTIQGVVVGIDDEVGADYDRTYPEDRGIFVQSLPRDVDDDPNTSEGVFVGYVDNPSNYRPGDIVRVTGQAKEKFGLTEIAEQIGQEPQKVGTTSVPEPVVLDQARAESQGAGRAYYESLENMRVQLAVGTANSGGTNKFGETFVTLGDVRDEFVFGEATPASLLALDADAGAGNPANPYKPASPSTTYTTADHFDRVENAVGPLSFSYSHYKLMPQPGQLPTVVDGPTQYPYDGLPAAEDGQLRIVAYNVLNFFPVGGFNDLSVITQAEYDEKRDRIAHAVDDLLDRPDVVALQEVVNLAIVQDLAEQLGGYEAYLIEGSDSRGIDQAFLIKDTVEVSNLRQLGASAGGCDDSGRLYDRPPLAIDVVAGDLAVTVINNHFKSKSGPDSCRDAQASYLRGQVSALESAGGHVVVTGDLNSFETDNAIRVLETGSTLTNLWSRSPDGTRYSNHYQGQLQTLDHTLITDGLEDRFVDFVYAPISSNYADRFTDGHKIADHNPMVLTLQAGVADACPDGYPADRTVSFGGVDSGVANVDDGDGCTILDLIWAEGPFASHSAFVRHVTTVAADFRAAGLITARQESSITRAATRAPTATED